MKTINAENKSHVVHFDLDVKSWEKSPPGVDACWPARCPCCGVPSLSPAGKVMLRSHGLRARQRWGPADAESGSRGVLRSLLERRYRCRACGAVVTVRPRGELAHRGYTASAITLAL